MRKSNPDLLKGLAIIFMVQVHIMELFALEEVCNSILGKVSLFLGGPPAAPVFMAVMGYFLAQTKKSPARQVLRGIKLIGLGLILNIGLNLHLLILIATGQLDINPWEYVLGVDILLLAGMSIIIIAILSGILKRNYPLFLLLAIIISFLSPLLSGQVTEDAPGKYIQAFFWGNYRWSYFPLLPWLSYPLAGYFLAFALEKLHANTRSNKIMFFFLVLFVVLMIFTMPWAFDITHNLTLYYHHGVLFFLWTLLFLSGWTAISGIIVSYLDDAVVVRYLRWVGKNTTAFYVVQWLIIGNVATAIYKTQEIEQLLLWFIGILLMSSLIVLLYNQWQKKRKIKMRF